MKRNIIRWKVTYGAILETRVRQSNLSTLVNSWDRTVWGTFDNCSLDKNCRIFLYWQLDKLDIQVIQFSDQFVHCTFETINKNWKGCVTFIYAQNSVDKRKQLWQTLTDLSKGMNSPWLLLGDFNVVLDSTEKISDSGSLISDELSTFFSLFDLHDHRFIGNNLTWDNGHTWCKLDRVLCNGIWESTFLGTVVEFLSKGISDHSPALVKVFSPTMSHSPSFKFKNFWADDPGFLPIIEKCMQLLDTGCAMFRMVHLLKSIKMHLRKLDGDTYKQLADQVMVAQSNLDMVQKKLHDNPLNMDVQTDAHVALERYISLNQKQLSLLQQKAKLQWSKDGDLNSQYFHAVIAQRRKLNSIYVLISPTGERLTTGPEIVQHIISYYTGLFGTSRLTSPVDMSLVNEACKVTTDMNTQLTKHLTI